MKKLIIFIVFFISCNSSAQNIRGFGGTSAFLHSDFKESLIVGINCGAEFEIKHYLKPEIEFNVVIGTAEEVVIRNNQGVRTNFFSRSAVAYNINFSPKICLGNKEENGSCFFISPKYSLSKVTAVGKYSSIINSVWVTEKESVNEWQHSLGIGVGYDLSVSVKNSNSLAITIYCQNINLGKILNSLNHSGDSRINTKYLFGAGLNYYFGTKKHNKD